MRVPARVRRQEQDRPPRAVYLREDHLIPQLDRWLATKFSPALLSGTIAELDQAQTSGQQDQAAELARQEFTGCDAMLRQHRAALEAGADPAFVTSWMAEVQAQRTLAEARLRTSPQPRRMAREEIADMVSGLNDIMNVLTHADPGRLGLGRALMIACYRLTYVLGQGRSSRFSFGS